MQWSKKPCSYLKTLIRQVQTGEQTQEVRLSEDMPDIGHVISTWGQPVIRSRQWQGDSISLSGGVSVWVLYFPEHGGTVEPMEVWVPFQMRWNLPQTQREGNMRFQCRLQGLDARMLSARKMMVRAEVAVLAEVLERTETDIYVPEDIPEDVQLLRETYPAVLPVEAGEKQFRFEEEIHIPQVKNWISWGVEPVITERSVVGNRLVFRGNGLLQYVYLDQGERICRGRTEIPFAQFVELDKEYGKDGTGDLMLAVASLEAETTAEGAKVSCEVNAQYVIRERELLEVVQDGYSPTSPVELTVEMLQLPMELDRRREKIQIPVELSQEKPLDILLFADFPTEFREEEAIRLKLSGSFQVLCEDAEQKLQTVSRDWAQELDIPAAENVKLVTTVQSVLMNETTGEIELESVFEANEQIPMVTDLSVGEKVTEERPSLIIRSMNKDSLWELAKSTGSTVEAIRKANGLTQEPEPGQLLLIPVS